MGKVMETVIETMTLRWEPCGAYDVDHECAFGTCVRCGWPCDDHSTGGGIAGEEVDDRRYAQAA